MQLSREVFAELEIRPGCYTGFHYSTVELPEFAVCEDVHGAYEPHVLPLYVFHHDEWALCGERQRRCQGVPVGPAEPRRRASSRRAQR